MTTVTPQAQKKLRQKRVLSGQFFSNRKLSKGKDNEFFSLYQAGFKRLLTMHY